MSGIIRLTRRDFLRHTGVGAGALVLGYNFASEGSLAATDLLHKAFTLSPFVSIHLNGTFVFFCNRPEMGQGIRTSLAAVLADELEADWSRVRLHQADADGPRYAVANPSTDPRAWPKFPISEEASQFADSSRSMVLYFNAMRLFGAGIRLVMIRAAAKKWGVKPEECEAREHEVHHKGSGRSIDYRWLLLQASKVAVPTAEEAAAALKPGRDWKLSGSRTGWFLNDATDMVTGRTVYGADADPGRPGTLTAMIVRCPVANGQVKSFDATAALAVPGVKYVQAVLPPGALGGGVGAGFTPHAGVAVLAENTWAAWQGRRALKVEWDLGPNAGYDSKAYRTELEASTSQPGKLLRHKGDVDSAFGASSHVVEADYYVPHLAQAPMEPPVATALYENGKWEIWSPTQGPEMAQHYVGLTLLEPNPVKGLLWLVTELTEVKESERKIVSDFNAALGKLLGVDEPTLFKLRDELKQKVREKVTVHVTFLGGGFGRKSKPDYAIEAALLATQHPGVPIRVQWTREDDLHFSFFHSVSHQRLKAALDAEGKATALHWRSAFPSFFASLFPPPFDPLPEAVRPIFAQARAAFHNGGEFPYASAIERAQGLEDMPFAVDHLRIENCPAINHIRCGWMRSVSNIFHAFSIGSFADEMAIAAGRDSKDYLLSLIGDGGILDLAGQGAEGFDNNGLPVKPDGFPVGSLPGYPPDTRRLRRVVERVAREAGWDDKAKQYKGSKGRGLGIAAHRSFLSYVAMVFDVSLDDERNLTINEIHAAIDCGTPVNPDRIIAQMEGGIVYGLSLALLGEITVKNGAVEQSNFDSYPVLRINQTPKSMKIHIVRPDDPPVPPDKENQELWRNPSGVGEPPVPPVAPALANAIFAAGGPRIRELPLYRFVQVL